MLKNLVPSPVAAVIKDGLEMIGQHLEKVPANTRMFAIGGHQVFFGYYDISPFSGDETLLLAQQAPGQNASPHKTHPELILGYYDLREKKPEFHRFGSTRTWNWQQGCRLQWYPSGRRDTRTVLYNTLVDGHFAAVVQNVRNSNIEKTIPRPVYAVSPNGDFALSLDFTRLHRYRRGYGYSNLEGATEENVIRHINLHAGSERTLLSMAEASTFLPLRSMKAAEHYFNHLSISPTGKRYMATHVWLTSQKRRYTRILVGDVNGGRLFCPNNLGRTSHYCWAGDDCVIIFASDAEGVMGYRLYDLESGTQRRFGKGVLKEDGHPTWRAPAWMVTDTYPDLFRLQKLYSYEEGGSLHEIAKFSTPQIFAGELRCDLHPRLSPSGRLVCVDIVRDYRRVMAVLPAQGGVV